MAEKVARTGAKRDKDSLLYVKGVGNKLHVMRVARKQPGVPKGKPESIAEAAGSIDTAYIYFVDKDGDIARARRAVGGQKRKKAAKTARKPAKKAAKKAAKKPAKKKAAKKGKRR